MSPLIPCSALKYLPKPKEIARLLSETIIWCETVCLSVSYSNIWAACVGIFIMFGGIGARRASVYNYESA